MRDPERPADTSSGFPAAGSSFFTSPCAMLPRARASVYAIYPLLPAAVDDIARRRLVARAPRRAAPLAAGEPTSTSCFPGTIKPPPRRRATPPPSPPPLRSFAPRGIFWPSIDRMEMDLRRGPPPAAKTGSSIFYCDRTKLASAVRPPFQEKGTQFFGHRAENRRQLAHHLAPRAAAHQPPCSTRRDSESGRPLICHAKGACIMPGIGGRRARRRSGDPAPSNHGSPKAPAGKVAARSSPSIFAAEATESCAACSAPLRSARPRPDGRPPTAAILAEAQCPALLPPRANAVRINKLRLLCALLRLRDRF